jgi:hypothetical protein
MALAVTESDPVALVKWRIQRQMDIPMAEQQLIYKGRILPDEELLWESASRSHPFVYLALPTALRAQGRELIVLDDCRSNRWAVVEVDPDEPIGELRKRLGVNPLMFGDSLLADDDSLRARAIPPLSRMRVTKAPGEMEIAILVHCRDEAVPVYVSEDGLVDDLVSVFRRIEDPLWVYDLFYHGDAPLENGQSLRKVPGLSNGSIVHTIFIPPTS